MRIEMESLNGHPVPSVGFGTADLEDHVEASVEAAIRAGYRLIDTARVYGSEEGVGRAIAKCIAEGIVTREDLFVQTKLDPACHSYEGVLNSFRRSQKALGLSYVDQYLIHWPVPRGQERECYVANREAWRAFETLYDNGAVRMLGVCNFLERHLADLMENSRIQPMTNQLEIHPAFQQCGLVRYCRKLGMYIQAWSPMGRGCLKNEKWKTRATDYGKDVGQLALRWSVEHGFIPLARSSSFEHIQSNLDIFDFRLKQKDLDELDAMNTCDQHMDIWAYKRQQMY